jgi:hypothetical protein
MIDCRVRAETSYKYVVKIVTDPTAGAKKLGVFLESIQELNI